MNHYYQSIQPQLIGASQGKFVPVLNYAPSQDHARRSRGIAARILNLGIFTLGGN
jgi:hypothetical protein